MLATCICRNGSLLDQLSCTIVNLFTCTFGRINMSVCLSLACALKSNISDISMERNRVKKIILNFSPYFFILIIINIQWNDWVEK